MIDKRVASAAEAVSDIFDGATIMFGGFGEAGSPIELIHALIDQGATDLTMISNNCGSGQVGLAALLKAGRVSKVVCSFPRTANSTVFPELYRSGREDTLLGMKQLREMAYAMRDAIEDGDADRLGAMLHEAFEAKKRMNPHIAEHTPIEAMLRGAQDAGASGGKICGAGGGGYLMLYCLPQRQGAVRAELERLGARFAPFVLWPDGVRARRADRVWLPT